MNHSRREAIKLLGTTSLLAISPRLAANTSSPIQGQAPERRLKLRNLHTEESLDATYWVTGGYVKESLKEINHLLRDHRNGQVTDMDPSLLDSLFSLQSRLGHSKEVQIISGYRSPQTNELLRSQGHKVAKHSFHTKGKALDIRLPGRALNDVHKAALDLKSGGVGYYPGSDFIHLDTGRRRRWG